MTTRTARRPRHEDRPVATPSTNAGTHPSWLGFAAVVAVAFVVRLLHLIDYSRLPIFDRPSVDAALYVDAARRLATTGDWPPVFFKPPLYPLLLSAYWRVVGENYFWLRSPGVCIGAATCGLVYLLTRQLYGSRVALVAGLLYALHRTAVYFDTELLEIGVVTCVQLSALLLVLRARRPGAGPRQALLAGLGLGIGSVARPTFLLFAAVALLWLGRRRWIPALAGILLALLPVTLHNAVRGHDLVLVSSNLGLNFYLGNNPNASGRIAAAAELPANPAAAERLSARIAAESAGHPLRPSQVSAFWLRRGLEYDARHPGTSLALFGRKLFYAWNAAEISDNEDLSGLRHHLRLYAALPVGMWILAPLGLVGCIAAARRRGPRPDGPRLAALYIAAQVVALLPFFIVGRFRLPWTPVLALFSAWTLVELVTRLRRRGGSARPLAGGAALAWIACNAPLLGVRAPVDFDLDYKIGYAYQQKGRISEAMESYQRSIERHPQAALARNALGVLLAERGERLDEAAALVRKAIELDPGLAAHYDESLARVELRRGAPQAALQACASGLEATPDAPTRAALLFRRAEAERQLGHAAAERTALLEALDAAPQAPDAALARRRLSEMETHGGVRP